MSAKLERQIHALRRDGHTEREAAAILGFSRGALRNRCAQYGIRWNLTRRFWEQYEDDYLRRLYPHFLTRTIAEGLERTERQVYARAKQLGLRKHPAYMDTPEAGRLDGQRGSGTRFPKGNVPFNKGRKGIRMAPETEFKPGHRPQTWVPVGTEVVDREGYRKRKVRDDAPRGQSRFNWRFVHNLKWEKHRGPIPKGHVIVFRNGDRSDIRIANLECIHRADLARRNTMWNRYPYEVARTIHHLGQFKRRLREHEEQAQ